MTREMIDGQVCDCGQWAQCCGCGHHSLQAGVETPEHGWLIHWRGAHWSGKCALRVLELERKAQAAIPASCPPTAQTEEVDYAWATYGDEWLEASIFAAIDGYSGFEMDWEMAKRDVEPNGHDAVTTTRALADAIRERFALDSAAKDEIVENAVELFKALESWDWFTDPANRILYWTWFDELEKNVRAYRIAHGEPLIPAPQRVVTADSSTLVIPPGPGVREPPPWRRGDHAEQIVDAIRGPRSAKEQSGD
jgi:hypothetical protein